MNQREAVIEVMRANGGFATLGHLYRQVLQVPDVAWQTTTPFKSINRIVQNPKFFFRIRPGLWALIEAKDTLPADLRSHPKPETDHTYYQGLLVELGNLKKQRTFVPKQDRNRSFLGKKLGDLATLDELYPFTYQDIVTRASTIDVIWFNERRMPTELFEVENTSDMHSALLKFFMLDAFHVVFRMVARSARSREYQQKVSHPAFASLSGRVKFTDYQLVADLHSKASQTHALELAWVA